MAEIALPNEIVRTVTVKRFPGRLSQAIGSVMMGWLFTNFSWTPIANGKWQLTMRWKRSDGRMSAVTSPGYNGEWTSGLPLSSEHLMEIKQFQVYPNAGIRTTLRMLWLLLWSKPSKETNP